MEQLKIRKNLESKTSSMDVAIEVDSENENENDDEWNDSLTLSDK